MNREPRLDELIGADATGAERQRLQKVHDMLLEAGPPPELTPELEAGPNLRMASLKRRSVVKHRAMVLLAASIAVVLVFLGGYAVANRNGNSKPTTAVLAQELKGTAIAPKATGDLEVWKSKDGKNWPMTLQVSGLRRLQPHTYYEVYLFRHGQLGGSCGSFRSAGADQTTTVTLTSPYPLHKGDSWVVTRPGAGGMEPGPLVLRPVTA